MGEPVPEFPSLPDQLNVAPGVVEVMLMVYPPAVAKVGPVQVE